MALAVSNQMWGNDTEAAEDTMQGKYLVFLLDEEQYAIAITYVIDIINIQPITYVPSCPPFVKGITNLRGKVIPIVDLRLRFGKAPQDYNDRTCIIVVEEQEASVGLIVDRVTEVTTIGDEHISPLPDYQEDNRFIQSIGRSESGVSLILNCQMVLDDDLIESIPADY